MLTINDYEALLHEIKNSVSVVSCSLQLIEKQHPGVKDYAFWNDTAADLLGLRALLTDVADTHLCDFPQKKKVNIACFLREIENSYPGRDDENHPLIIKIDPDAKDGFFDAHRIRHALFRILDNAFEALYDDGIVELCAFPKDNGIVFEITDNGKGIPKDALPHICRPFFGSGNGKNGLGLFISKGIVDSHDGSLTIISEHERGTTVTIFLPSA